MHRGANLPKKRVEEAPMYRAQLWPPQHWAYARLDPVPQGRSSSVPTLSAITNIIPHWLPLEKPTGNGQRQKAQGLSSSCQICSLCVQKQGRVSASSLFFGQSWLKYFWPRMSQVLTTQIASADPLPGECIIYFIRVGRVSLTVFNWPHSCQRASVSRT